MNNVIVGELICALWENWQVQRQTRLNTLSPRVEHKNVKLFADQHDGNQSTLTSSRVPTSTIHDDHYILSPLRL